MTIRERVEDWKFIQNISPDDPNLKRVILAVHWKHMSDTEAMSELQMDARTFRRYKRAYEEMKNYLCC